MATSELGHYVRFAEATMASPSTEEAPFSAGHARRTIGNINHLADQYAQRRIAWIRRTGEHFGIAFPVVGDNTFYFVWASTPFDVHIAAGGESYRFRARIRTSSDDAVAAATFRVVLHRDGVGVPDLFEAGPNSDEIAVVRSGFAWDSLDVIYLDSARLGSAQAPVS